MACHRARQRPALHSAVRVAVLVALSSTVTGQSAEQLEEDVSKLVKADLTKPVCDKLASYLRELTNRTFSSDEQLSADNAIYDIASAFCQAPKPYRPLDIDYLSLGLSVAERRDWGPQIVYFAYYAGNRALLESDFDAAVGLFEKALKQPTCAITCLVHAEFAELQRVLGDHRRAHEHLTEALDLLSPVPPDTRIAAMVQGRATSLLLTYGRLDKAGSHNRQELKLAEGDPELSLSAVCHRVEYLIGRHDFLRARKEADAGLSAYAATDAAPLRAQLCLLAAIAEGRIALEDSSVVDSALRRFAAALDDPTLPRLNALDARLGVAALHLERGDLESAQRFCDQAREMVAKSNNHLRAADVATLSARIAMRRAIDRKSALEELSSHRTELKQCFKAVCQEWQSYPLTIDGVGLMHYLERRELLATLISLELALDPDAGVKASLSHIVEAQCASTTARRWHLQGQSIDTYLRQLVPGNGGMLIYAPSAHGSHLFALERSTITHYQLAGDRHLAHNVRSLNDQLWQPPIGAHSIAISECNRLAQAAADWALPQELRSHICAWESIAIVGSDLLGGLPFEVLPVEGQPMGSRFCLYHIPSLPIGLALLERSQCRITPMARRVGLIWASTIDPGLCGRYQLQPIPDHRALLDGLTDAVTGLPIKTFQGASAHVANLELQLPECEILHVVAHGVHDSDLACSTGLLLAPHQSHSGLIDCAAVERLPIPRLAILLVCGAARGPVRRGDDGLQQLGGACMRGGAQAVILSSADLSLDSSMQMSKAFYRAFLEEGMSAAKALRHARQVVSKQSGREHPFHWGTLRLEGVDYWTQPAIFSRAPEWIPTKDRLSVVFVGLLGVVLVGALILRRRSRRFASP